MPTLEKASASKGGRKAHVTLLSGSRINGRQKGGTAEKAEERLTLLPESRINRNIGLRGF